MKMYIKIKSKKISSISDADLKFKCQRCEWSPEASNYSVQPQLIHINKHRMCILHLILSFVSNTALLIFHTVETQHPANSKYQMKHPF